LRWGLGAERVHYLYKRRLRTDQASGDLMMGVASWFYERVLDTILECLIEKVWKSKKLIDDQNARVFDGH
jgi:hypothetical protein